jgi:glycerate kinase
MPLGRRQLVIIAACGSAALLLAAFAFQHVGGMAPCALCVWQRWPHAVAVACGAVAFFALPRVMAGAGMLAALGAVADPPDALDGGAAALVTLTSIDLASVRRRLGGCRLVAASDVTSPLLGLRGATNVYGPQKGLTKERLFAVDGALSAFAHLVDRSSADVPGAGAAGGLGFALIVLGAQPRPGLELVAQASGFAETLRGADLVLTGEGSLDPQTFTGKVVAGVAGLASSAGVPCVALAGRVEVGSRELRAAGIDAAYSLVDAFGAGPALERPDDTLADLAERVARTWGV